MGGKSGGAKVPVTHYYMSVHMGLCHGVLDSVNRILFNDKIGWDESEVPLQPPIPYNGILVSSTFGELGGAFETTLQSGVFTGARTRIFVRYAKQTISMSDVWLMVDDPTSPDLAGRTRLVEPRQTLKQYFRYSCTLYFYDKRTKELLTTRTADWDYNISSAGEDGGGFGAAILAVGTPVSFSDYSRVMLVIVANGYIDPGPPMPPGPITSETTIEINKPDLFGGKKKEGGVAGKVHIQMGTLDQSMPAKLAAKFNRTPETMPAYRGVANMFFYNGQGQAGFYWGSNRYYLPDVSVNVTRIPVGLNSTLARIGKDANPAHIIYECMSNSDWGMGAPATSFDLDSFNAAAQTLYDEKFGLSMIWKDQMEIEKFVSEVIDHIEANLFVHPRNGKFTLRLIRDDYDVDTLREFNPDNSTLKNFQRKGWGETINEITVTYKNPDNEEDISFTIQDNSNIAMQGAVITDNRNYYGIRNRELAARVAQRDLRASSAPLCSCDIEMDRRAWDLVPGDVILVTWPEYSLNKLPMRVGPIDYGKKGTPRVRASLIEDVFFLPTADSYYIPPDTEWEDVRETAAPIEPSKVITLPLYLALRQPGAGSEEEVLQIPYPEVAAGVLGASYQRDAQDYTMMTEVANSLGDLEFQEVGVRSLLGHGYIEEGIGLEGVSYIKIVDFTPKGGPVVGGFALIGDEPDQRSELVAFESYEANVGWRIRRGILDTVPREWPADTPLWFLSVDDVLSDDLMRFDTDTPKYKLLTRTSLNTLNPIYAPDLTGELNGRPHYPFRPANVRLQGVLWGPSVIDGGTANLTWSTRNRRQETAVVLPWTDNSILPEEGQTTKVTWLDHDDNVLVTQADLIDTTTVLNFSEIPGPSVKYRVEAERDGLQSLQAVEYQADVAGYGMNYGNYYGGKP